MSGPVSHLFGRSREEDEETAVPRGRLTSDPEMKFVVSAAASFHPAALEILAIPLVLLRFPPCHPGSPTGLMLSKLH
jgi:hypothetical protein